jgi:hypothetical protein
MVGRRLWIGTLFVVASLLAIRSASASPIVVNAGQTLTFNFDFVASGAVPPPPYPGVLFRPGTVLATLDAGDAGTWTLFTGPNGSGVVGYGPDPGLNLTAVNSTLAGITDGVFSAVLTLTSGSITVDPVAFGLSENGSIITGQIHPLAPTAVPEPATLTLLGTALAGFGARRWRNRRQRG